MDLSLLAISLAFAGLWLYSLAGFLERRRLRKRLKESRDLLREWKPGEVRSVSNYQGQIEIATLPTVPVCQVYHDKLPATAEVGDVAILKRPDLGTRDAYIYTGRVWEPLPPMEYRRPYPGGPRQGHELKRCNASNPPGAFFCRACGMRIRYALTGSADSPHTHTPASRG